MNELDCCSRNSDLAGEHETRREDYGHDDAGSVFPTTRFRRSRIRGGRRVHRETAGRVEQYVANYPKPPHFRKHSGDRYRSTGRLRKGASTGCCYGEDDPVLRRLASALRRFNGKRRSLAIALASRGRSVT